MLDTCRLCGSDNLTLWMRDGHNSDLDFYRCGNRCGITISIVASIRRSTRRPMSAPKTRSIDSIPAFAKAGNFFAGTLTGPA